MKLSYIALILFNIAYIIGFTIYFPGIDASRYGDDFVPVPQESLSEDIVKTWTSVYQRQMFLLRQQMKV